jgi:hypothetical protein
MGKAKRSSWADGTAEGQELVRRAEHAQAERERRMARRVSGDALVDFLAVDTAKLGWALRTMSGRGKGKEQLRRLALGPDTPPGVRLSALKLIGDLARLYVTVRYAAGKAQAPQSDAVEIHEVEWASEGDQT